MLGRLNERFIGLFFLAGLLGTVFHLACAGTPEAKSRRHASEQVVTRNRVHSESATHETAQNRAGVPVTSVTISNDFSRADDPVVMTGKMLPTVVGVSPVRLGLFRCALNETLVPIPVQIDERLPKGGFAFASGQGASRDPDANFDANDELVFMARDTGARCLGVPLPDGVGNRLEIEVRDPANGSSGWVYLFAYPVTAPRAARDYVKAVFDRPAGDWRIEADNYVVEFAKNALYYNYVSIKQHDGAWTPNMVDRLKIRGSVSMFFNTLQFDFKAEELSKTQMVAWTDGSVRVIFHLTGFFEALIKIPIKTDLLIEAYPSYFIFPLHIEIPVDLGAILSKVSLHGVNDFSPNIYDYNVRFYDAYNPIRPNVVFDGMLSEEEWLLNYNDDRDWVALYGDGVAAANRIFFPKEMSYVSKRLYLGENPDQPDAPETTPGIIALGYDFDGLINLKKGSYTIYLHFYFPANFEPGNENRFLDITDRPLQPVVRSLTGK